MSLQLEATDTTEWDLNLAEQQALERALAQALAPARFAAEPSEKFVARLGQQLVETARREEEAQLRREQQLRTASLVGGVASVVGGLLVWLLWRQHHKASDAGAGSKPVVAWSIKPFSRAHHPARS
jgi:hypothetical protein